MISEFVDRQAANADLYELEDVLTGEKRQYRIVSKATVTQPGTDLNKATLDPILEAVLSAKGIADSGGSNSTGYWVKFDDGTMIWYKATGASVGFSQKGSLYMSNWITLGTFPVPFTNLYYINASLTVTHNGAWTTSVDGCTKTSAGRVAVLSAESIASMPASIGCFAIGRWK